MVILVGERDKGTVPLSQDLGSASQVPKGESLASEAEPGVSGELESLLEGGVGHRDGSSVPVFARSSEGFRRKLWSVSGTREPSPCPS